MSETTAVIENGFDVKLKLTRYACPSDIPNERKKHPVNVGPDVEFNRDKLVSMSADDIYLSLVMNK